MKRFARGLSWLPVALLGVMVLVVSCADSSGPNRKVTKRKPTPRPNLAVALKSHPNITWLPKQVSGRFDGASALDNIRASAAGSSVKRSSYGTAPGGYVPLDRRMLRAIKRLADQGYRFRVTSLAGGSHSRTSRHYAGLAFDIDLINGRKVGYSNPHWRTFLRQCEAMGATETLGPGDRGHSTHLHAAWPR